ncbi:MAG: hypothetical protein NZ730_05080 [Porticoccaceae bacterium]|nr:hypothetical protein [Porticoccaceae bacterium]
MNKGIVFVIVSLISVSGFADHHKGERDKGPGHERWRGDLFKEADLDNDDKVSFAEHEAMVQRMSDRGRARFQEMDSDGDGFVTKKEARKARTAHKRKMKAKHKKRKDLDKEGKGSSDE